MINLRSLSTGILAYLIWGCFPLLFSLVSSVAPLEVISARIFWSFLFCSLLLLGLGQWQSLKKVFSKKALLWSFIAALLISTNWLVFVYAVNNGQVIQSSLGYFLTPIVSVFLARFILQEHISRRQAISIALAIIAILIEVLRIQSLPWISLLLALSFGLYGLVRKQAPFEALNGLLMETGWLLLPALAYLALQQSPGLQPYPVNSIGFYLALSGIVTAVPLLLFSAAARKLPLSVIGFIMYINPIMQFITAIFIFKEGFELQQLFSFALIWLAVLIFCYDLYQNSRQRV
ncbi:chloramphenicol-sensitive protein RarD [Oceanospirillum multiglobuliferum]|uniref:EamA domain-containing protein n=1 Tax=Oceanospirillum multiglobuliferum TaxID=64969 RepID=A0A1T4PTI5_9GAMM|nr:EamA family transporter RarD [Oceanospirillum multiglobuliferum]OPX55324.1 hypothetical protein BTE48_09150 [Oceanospirillum multiglobuliferum]SJZ94822.1 chloramphenicol-sensitive protein RarD [Oceanospirillum multiglobuliferum]